MIETPYLDRIEYFAGRAAGPRKRYPKGDKRGGQFAPKNANLARANIPVAHRRTPGASLFLVGKTPFDGVPRQLSGSRGGPGKQFTHGETGERIAAGYLTKLGYKKVGFLHVGRNNVPVDIAADHLLAEVKTGLISNGKSAQQWRIVRGQPGIKTRAALKKMDGVTKQKFHSAMHAVSIKAKRDMVRRVERQIGRKVKTATIGIILDTDRKRAHLYMFKGFHKRIGWTSKEAKKGFVGEFEYDIGATWPW